jgi:oligopeptidase B
MHSIENKHAAEHFMAALRSRPLLLGNRTAWALEKLGTGRWPKVAPPQSPRISHVIDQLGRKRDDTYSWMKFIPAGGERTRDNLPEAVGTMLKAENEYADAILAPLAGERAKLLDAMLARASGDVAAPALEKDGWDYGSARPAGATHAVYTRSRKGGKPEELVDEAERAKGQPYFRSTGHQPSPDHRYFAWAEDVIGNDRHRICIRDNAKRRGPHDRRQGCLWLWRAGLRPLVALAVLDLARRAQPADAALSHFGRRQGHRPCL